MMKRNLTFISIFPALVLFAAACAKAPATDNTTSAPAGNAKGFYGVYEGVLPAADCPGIRTELTLNADGTFSKLSEYLERDSKYVDEGTFVLEEGLLTTTDKTGEVFYYQLQEGALQQLDMQGQPIEGEMASFYILKQK